MEFQRGTNEEIKNKLIEELKGQSCKDGSAEYVKLLPIIKSIVQDLGISETYANKLTLDSFRNTVYIYFNVGGDCVIPVLELIANRKLDKESKSRKDYIWEDFDALVYGYNDLYQAMTALIIKYYGNSSLIKI